MVCKTSRLLRNAFSVVVLCFCLLGALTGIAQDIKRAFPESFTVQVSNPLKADRENVLVHIADSEIAKKTKTFNPAAFVVMLGDREIASQFNDKESISPGIVLVLDRMAAGENISLTVRYNKVGKAPRNYVKRTQAELSHKVGGKFVNREYIDGTFKNVDFLRVPKEHKDHSWFIRYEGPGWESDKVGYRFYLDQRNATDVFGKKTTDMVLQMIGQDGFDSYHEMQAWGMDVMKVGKSLGVGSIGFLSNGTVHRVEKTDSVACRVSRNGDVYSSIDTYYYGWAIPENRISLRSTLAIHAGARHTRERIEVTAGSTDKLCTGIVKDEKAKLYTSRGDDSAFGYMATFGDQSLNNDGLGLAVLFRARDLDDFSSDQFSHIMTLNVSGNRLEYYFLATWSGEPGGIADERAFLAYLDALAKELANPVTVSVKK